MKFLVAFVAVLAVAAGARHRWTLTELSDAIQSPTTNPSFLPALEHGLNVYMEALFSGQQHEYIYLSTGAVDLSGWSLNDLSNALENPATDPALLPYLEKALNVLMEHLFAGEPVVAPSSAVVIPARDISYWTLNQLTDAIDSVETSPVMVPFLLDGLNHIMEALFSGKDAHAIVLAIPMEIVQAAQEAMPAPMPVPNPIPGVVVEPNEPVAPVAPVAPATPEASSPLVQIILNINQNEAGQQIVDVVGGAILPYPVIERPTPVVSVNPIDVLAPLPISPEVNPIDIIAVSP